MNYMIVVMKVVFEEVKVFYLGFDFKVLEEVIYVVDLDNKNVLLKEVIFEIVELIVKNFIMV